MTTLQKQFTGVAAALAIIGFSAWNSASVEEKKIEAPQTQQNTVLDRK